MTPPVILAIDQGTTSSRAIVFDREGCVVALAQMPFEQLFPQEGWVEHRPETIWNTTLQVARQAMAEAVGKSCRVVAVGITNQRETTIVWDKQTGNPIYNAIVWQDRRTADDCTALARDGHEAVIADKTGLLIDPYFSATKIAWILDHVPGARGMAEKGRLAFGTVDSFLIWRLTGGKVHATDATNASRTALFNIHSGAFDDDLLRIFNVPASILPEVRDSAAYFGDTTEDLFGRPLPILGVAGDQQAAAMGQRCFNPGNIKSTYGTGCFVLMNTGHQILQSKNRLLSTIAYRLDGRDTYCLEGAIFNAGAIVQWLRDKLGIIDNASDTEAIAAQLDGNHGVYMVPAFTGLGAPYWQPDARGLLYGLCRDTGPAELVRAALESVAYQTHDLLLAMAKDGIRPTSLRVDGGMSGNNWVMQFLADIVSLPIERPEMMETTALGAAWLAGYKAGVYDSLGALPTTWRSETRFEPTMREEARIGLLEGWRNAINRTILK